MHELRAVEIGLVVRPRDLQQRGHQRHRDQHGIDDRVAARRAREARRRRETRRASPSARTAASSADRPRAGTYSRRRLRAPIQRLTSRKTPTVASSVSTVETTSATRERDAVFAEQAEILHDADAGGHEQQRQRAEQSRSPRARRRLRRALRRSSAGAGSRARGPPSAARGRSPAPARASASPRASDLADELTQKQEEESADHGRVFAAARAKVNPAPPYPPAMIDLRKATWRAKAARPGGLALTVVRGRRATKALLTST